uniref:Uncharacterized protein n=1 Tax=Anguilla anguilla TaxID=7936 RepID=A0A0E9Q0B1_ANGAN
MNKINFVVFLIAGLQIAGIGEQDIMKFFYISYGIFLTCIHNFDFIKKKS